MANENYINWLKRLVDEFSVPLKTSYTGAPFIHTELINNLVVELSSTDEMLSKNQRRLLVGLNDKNQALAVNDNKRDVYINDWNIRGHQFEKSEEIKTSQNIEFWTAQILREVVEIIFYTSKFNEENSNFIFGEYDIIEQIKAVCKYSSLDYDESFWKKVILRIAA
ncbi:hypothetical protein [Shewanella sp. HL-SH2]|uniref:hypothetical protein n=1 Tax=Shewanella sp. HL-SH2 TaxID=3436238 RepID=UPI003EBB1188